MSRGNWIAVAVSSFVAIGNAQDAGVTPTTNVYGTQGNVATNRSLLQAEQDRATEAARQKKALMAAMAAQSMAAAPRPTTAAEFLAANKPNWPTPPPTNPDLTGASSPAFGERRERIAPTLPDPQSRPSAPVPQFDPPRKPGLLDKLKSRGSDEADFVNPYESVPAATYEDSSSTPPEPVTMSPEEAAARDEAMMDSVSSPGAVEMPGREEKSGLFGKLFNRNRDEASEPELIPSPAPDPQVDLPPEMVEAPATPEERVDAPIPEPEPFETAEVAPEPAPAPATVPTAPVADIFSRRANADMAAGETATVATDVQADVGGVLVTLYEGTQVGVISRDGGTAKIRLKDQREGTVSASALR